MLLEEFENCLPERIVVYLNEQKVVPLQRAATLTDEFALTHKSVFRPEMSSHRSSSQRSGDAPCHPLIPSPRNSVSFATKLDM